MNKRLQIALCFSAFVFALGAGLLGSEAVFTPSNYNPAVGESVTFEVCQDPLISGADHYEWDFDGDGLYELSTEEPRATRAFSEAGYVEVSLQVIDTSGRLIEQRKGILIGESPLYAVREVTDEEGGVTLVRVTVSARAAIRAVGLEETIPRGWQVEVVDAGNTISKKEGEYLRFLWMNPIEPGEMWTITYRLYPSYGVGSPTLAGSISGYAETRIKVPVCGDLTILR
jgi:hypothetical protein